jgi:hypothetical protein
MIMPHELFFCAGARGPGGVWRVFLDLIFYKLPRAPKLGEEVNTQYFAELPGGGLATWLGKKPLGSQTAPSEDGTSHRNRDQDADSDSRAARAAPVWPSEIQLQGELNLTWIARPS